MRENVRGQGLPQEQDLGHLPQAEKSGAPQEGWGGGEVSSASFLRPVSRLTTLFSLVASMFPPHGLSLAAPTAPPHSLRVQPPSPCGSQLGRELVPCGRQREQALCDQVSLALLLPSALRLWTLPQQPEHQFPIWKIEVTITSTSPIRRRHLKHTE